MRGAIIALALVFTGAAHAAPVDVPVPDRFAQAMSVISPDARPSREYTMEKRSDGLHLTDWSLPGSPPTGTTITAALATYDWQAYQVTARAAMQATDIVALRCFKAGVAYPAEWRTYYLALRAILTATSGDPTQPLPARPAFPAGT